MFSFVEGFPVFCDFSIQLLISTEAINFSWKWLTKDLELSQSLGFRELFCAAWTSLEPKDVVISATDTKTP